MHTAGVLVLWDLENCRMPKNIPAQEVISYIRAAFVNNKGGCGELGFVISMTDTVKLGHAMEKMLRYAGVEVRRCLGKAGGKNEEAENYLATEYNYVKRIISNLAGKQLRHLVLLGGDADCFQLLEVALTDGVACELLYQPEGVDVKSYLPGLTCRGVKCYNYFAAVANGAKRPAVFQYPNSKGGSSTKYEVKPGVPELYSAGASVALHNTTQPVAAENKIQPLLMQASKTVHFVLTTTQERTIRIYLPGPGSFLAGSLEDSNCSKALTSIRTAERPSLWLLKIGHVFKTDANGVAGMLGRLQHRESGKYLAIPAGAVAAYMSNYLPGALSAVNIPAAVTSSSSCIHLASEVDALKSGRYLTDWLVQVITKPTDIKKAELERAKVLINQLADHTDLMRVLEDGVPVHISIPGTGMFMAAASGFEAAGNGDLLGILQVPPKQKPQQSSGIIWLSGARGTEVKKLVADAGWCAE